MSIFLATPLTNNHPVLQHVVVDVLPRQGRYMVAMLAVTGSFRPAMRLDAFRGLTVVFGAVDTGPKPKLPKRMPICSLLAKKLCW